MKVAELREKLGKLKKDEIIKLAAEFYKLVPKSKKEDYDIDSLINNPNKKRTVGKVATKLSLAEIEIEIEEFIKNAKSQNYLFPNKIISKKERSTWRFKVKKWFKELTNTKRADFDLDKQSRLLSKLYELICESCGYEYFSAYDSFQSIGIQQTEFYRAVINLLQENKGKGESLGKAINLIVNNYLNRYTLYSNLMQELLLTLDLPDLKERGIEIGKKLIAEHGYKPEINNKTGSWSFSSGEYRKREKHNNLTELVFRLYDNLFDTQKGVDFYKENHYERSDEVKLYILVSLLFESGNKEQIRIEIEKAIESGIQPRKKLLEIFEEIKEKNTLPKYL